MDRRNFLTMSGLGLAGLMVPFGRVIAAEELNGNKRINSVCSEVIEGPVTREEMARAMFRCGAWVVPSIEEGFGLVGLEAMAAGCVLITAAPGGMKTYVRADENAIRVFNPLSRSQWGQMMRAYLGNDPAEIAEMRRRGRETAERFTLQRAATRFAEIILGREAEDEDRKDVPVVEGDADER